MEIADHLIVAAKYYDKYIDRVKHMPVLEALRSGEEKFVTFLKGIPESAWDFAYSEGKWTVKQVVLHVCDTERVMAYRALWFARGSTSPLPSMDQESFAVGALNVSRRSAESLITEFKAVRSSTLALFAHLGETELSRKGIASDNEVSVMALAYIIAGHALHHQQVIAERYLQPVD
jgi:hypothetical protein